jgi:hypothetical protein
MDSKLLKMKEFRKEFLLVSLAILLFGNVFGQGNLQFNQVISMNFSATGFDGGNFPWDIQPVTIPSGKVWKIESVRLTERDDSAPVYYRSNNAAAFIIGENLIETGSATSNYPFPVWLPAGNYSFKLQGESWSAGYSYYCLVSIIEFNVIP